MKATTAQIQTQAQAQTHTQSQQRLNNRAALLKALAHPTRLWLVEQLEHQERCVCELTDGVDADISTVSKHLALLRQAGIVASRRVGKQIYYRLETPCLLGMLSCIETALAQSPGCCAKSLAAKTDKAKAIQSVR
ncbi:metalloregulator ArsR/SmtB family transcription factor [Shewanella loihica]|uniref:Transcriptional regulator, ArsR family n=1 Tax=Shewanella loihica (strain ATCC BAA-1088 / PV-4) TaxID=323850 RepID=A3QA62_SHELP|nr:metalloregulator ArsR/SmtB family transcription factor [Shewanella loihica]ABO22360.1 transcriptional regulator, ArsR family [Shewanella loihica PV-4]